MGAKLIFGQNRDSEGTYVLRIMNCVFYILNEIQIIRIISLGNFQIKNIPYSLQSLGNIA